MKKWLTLFIVVTAYTGFSQQKEIVFNLDKKGDTTQHYLNQINLGKQIHVKRFEASTDKFHFRLTTERNVIDVGESNDGKFYGSVTHWVSEVPPENEPPIDRKFGKTYALNETQAKQIIQLVKEEKLTNIPDQREVPYWSTRPNGTTYFIEHSNTEKYFFKTFKAPSGQKDVPEALIIQKIIDETISISKAKATWKSFLVECPLECFHTGQGSAVTCIPRSPKEQKALKKARKKFREGI